MKEATIHLTGCNTGVSPSNNSNRGEKKGPEDYFLDTYGQCRAAFVSAAERITRGRHGALVSRLAVPSALDGDLTIDYCYLPPAAKKKRLLVMSSGVHGVEGFAGSAVQRLFMEEIAPELADKNLGVLLIHGINPYGFKYLRRVTEHNVDLNRNFIQEHLFFAQSRNTHYSGLGPIINPRGKVVISNLAFAAIITRFLLFMARHSFTTVVRAVLRGQYEFKQGLYFGGWRSEPQNRRLRGLIRTIAEPYRSVFLIDLHTGYGDLGELCFFPTRTVDGQSRQAMEALFDGYTLLDEDGSDYYDISGDFTIYTGFLLPRDRLYVPMTFDFGTFNSTSKIEMLRSLITMILENQAHHHGCVYPWEERKIKRHFLELFYPSSREWREGVLERMRAVLPVLLDRYAGYKPETAG